MEAARRASLIDEEACQLRVLEVDVGASSSRVFEAERSITDGVVITEDTTDGVPITNERVLGNRTNRYVDRPRYPPQICFTYHRTLYTYMHWG